MKETRHEPSDPAWIMEAEMESEYRPFVPCLYPELCENCDGIPENVDVHLKSGEHLQLRDIAGIDLTAGEIILRAPDGSAQSFRRANVVYAGCARVPPLPFN